VKPLSETHPTLQKKFIETGWILEGEDWDVHYEQLLNEVQSCTVDVREHERIVEELEFLLKEAGEREEQFENAYGRWVKKGEIETLRRVKEAIKKLYNKDPLVFDMLEDELGLDEVKEE
jgi:SepF-like predicted cell division protein (DUF552 family)